MPWLKNKKKKRREWNKNLYRKNYYLTKKWILLRDAKRLEEPLCEVCKYKNITSLMAEVHHIIPIKSGITPIEQEFLAYDIDNLLCLCVKCHNDLHIMIKKEPGSYWNLVREVEKNKGD